MVDSNLDWGQDVKRLKHFLDEQTMTNIDLEYLGPERAIDYYGIAARRVSSGEAYGTRRGTLVVSAWYLMNPAWDWLRASHEPVARVGYTMFVYSLGDAETKERWEKMLRVDPNDARAHYNLGIVLERAGETAGAITHYEQAIRIRPDFAMAHYNLAVAQQRAGKVTDAIKQYEQVLQLEPGLGEADAHNNLGSALVQTGKIEEAIAHYQQALWLKPDFVEAHNNLGTALYQTGKREEAIEHYRQALRLKPDYTEARFNLGLALEKLGRTTEAIEQFEQTLKLRPDFAPARDALTRLGAGQ